MSSPPNFDVFVSFSLEDSNKKFVADLHGSLTSKDIKLEDITASTNDSASPDGSDLSKCIEESKLAVVVITESYPTSVGCLDQLQTILKSHEEGRLSILPIFYQVDPSKVRNQSGEFAEPFKKLDEEYPSDKVQAWRTSLTKLSNISSMDSRFWNDKGNIIDLINKKIRLIVSAKPFYPFETRTSGFFGLERHLEALHGLLDLKSKDEARLVALWGPGGVGKTTLARYVYVGMSNEFPVHMFVENAEEIYNKCSTYTQVSQETPFSKETHEMKAQTVRTTILQGSTDVIKSNVGYQKCLLVIDCVDNIKQLKDIADIISWCGSGSRVIFITEDKKLLDEFGVKYVYEVKSMRFDEALELFSQYAFDQQHPPSSFESLSLRAVQICRFLPLTLKVLGSFLQGKGEEEWEKELQALEGDGVKAIVEVMKKSYVRENEKDKISSFFLPLQ